MEIVQYALLVGLAWLLVEPYGVAGAAAAWIPAVFVSQLLGVRFVRAVVERPFAGLALPLAGVGAATMLGVAAAVGVDRMVAGMAGPLAAGIVGGLVAFGAIAVFDRRTETGLAATAGQVFPRLVPLLRAMRLSRMPSNNDRGTEEGS